MEKARKRLRMCLIAVVLLAVIVGCVYYFGDFEGKQDVTDGTLVRQLRNIPGEILENGQAGAFGGEIYGC